MRYHLWVIALDEDVNVIIHRTHADNPYLPPPCLAAEYCEEHQKIGDSVENKITFTTPLIEVYDSDTGRSIHLIIHLGAATDNSMD